MKGLPCLLVMVTAVGLASCSAPDSKRQSGARDTSQQGTGVLPTAASGARSIPITPENAKIEFVGSTPKHSQPGSFRRFTGQLDLSEAQTINRIVVDIDVDSTTTKIFLLTRHLKGADFFDVEHYPKASFVSTAIEGSPSGETVITGNLTFHGVTRQIRFPATFARDAGRLTMRATFTLRQSEFGMDKGAKMANDDVPVTVSLSAG